MEIERNEFEIGDTIYYEYNGDFYNYDFERIINISENIFDLIIYTDLLGVEWYCGFAIEWIGCDRAEDYVNHILNNCKNGDGRVTKLFIAQPDGNYRLTAEVGKDGKWELI